MINIKKRYNSLKKPNLPYVKELCKKYEVSNLVKLNYNENAFGPSPRLKRIISIENPNIYPDWKSPILINLISEKYRINPDQIYISNGSDSLLDIIPELFTQATNAENVIIPELTYGRIEQTCIVKNIEIKKIKLVNGYIDLGGIIKNIDSKTSLIYLVNPNMPTGKFHSHKNVVQFLKRVPPNILVVIDEAYIEYSVGIKQARKNDNNLLELFDNIIITHTFSKLYGLASFRIGFAISRNYIIEVFNKASQYLPLSVISSKAAEIVFEDDDYYETVISKITSEKEFYYKEFDKLNLKYFKSKGNYVFLSWNNAKSNTEFWEFLIKTQGILIRRIGDFAFRISVGKHEDNVSVIKGLNEFLNV